MDANRLAFLIGRAVGLYARRGGWMGADRCHNRMANVRNAQWFLGHADPSTEGYKATVRWYLVHVEVTVAILEAGLN